MNEEVELTDEQLEVEKQKIRDGVSTLNTDDVKLPSDGTEEKKYAGVYTSLDELKKGIQNLKADVPEYMLNGMNETALEQYYTDLRKEFSSKPKVDEPKVEEATEEPKVEEAKKTIGDELWKELDTEFATKGGLSDEYYDKLSKLGIPSNIVDGYLDGLKSKAMDFTNKVFELSGGQEQYNAIKAWAEENYSQAQLDMIASGTHDDILFKMKAVKADYDSKNGSTQTRIVGSQNNSNIAGYRTQDEYIMDVMSPEYRRSAKYKAKVDAKFKASSFYS